MAPTPAAVLKSLSVDELAGLCGLLAHPLRLQVVREIAESEAPVSPVHLATALEESLGNVSYHVRVLWKAGVLELEELVPVRGAVEHRYRIAPESPLVALIQLIRPRRRRRRRNPT